MLRGLGGEDGTVQTVLESLQTPYVGSTSLASQHCYDKVFMLKTLHQAGVLTPVSDLVAYDQLLQHPLTKQPFVFKSRFEGEGTDAYLIRDLSSFDATDYRPAFDKHGSMLLQNIVEGIEFSVGMLGDQPMTPVETAISGDGVVQQLCPPARLSLELQHQAQSLAYQVHTLLGCRHLSNIDMIWAADGKVYVIEIDALPGLNPGDPYIKAAEAAGLSMPALVDRLVRMAA
jgi:D-alanine-D-alanine ligase